MIDDLESLFHSYDLPIIEDDVEDLLSLGENSMIRCKCGNLINISIPCICSRCGSPKTFWKTSDGSYRHLRKLDLGHLSNLVKILASRLEVTPSARLETAIDLVYCEIQARDKEITQITGIGNALKKALSR